MGPRGSTAYAECSKQRGLPEPLRRPCLPESTPNRAQLAPLTSKLLQVHTQTP